MAEKLTDESLMPFGKYKGEKMANVPHGYLLYMYDSGKLFGAVKDYCEENINVLRFQKEQEDKKKKL